jgi:hypothetical protein
MEKKNRTPGGFLDFSQDQGKECIASIDDFGDAKAVFTHDSIESCFSGKFCSLVEKIDLQRLFGNMLHDLLFGKSADKRFAMERNQGHGFRIGLKFNEGG